MIKFNAKCQNPNVKKIQNANLKIQNDNVKFKMKL